MSKEGYAASLHGMGCDLKDILKENDVSVPKGFYDRENWYECFKVVKHSSDIREYGRRAGIWFADLEEDKFIDDNGNLVDEATGIMWVNEEDITFWE